VPEKESSSTRSRTKPESRDEHEGRLGFFLPGNTDEWNTLVSEFHSRLNKRTPYTTEDVYFFLNFWHSLPDLAVCASEDGFFSGCSVGAERGSWEHRIFDLKSLASEALEVFGTAAEDRGLDSGKIKKAKVVYLKYLRKLARLRLVEVQKLREPKTTLPEAIMQWGIASYEGGLLSLLLEKRVPTEWKRLKSMKAHPGLEKIGSELQHPMGVPTKREREEFEEGMAVLERLAFKLDGEEREKKKQPADAPTNGLEKEAGPSRSPEMPLIELCRRYRNKWNVKSDRVKLSLHDYDLKQKEGKHLWTIRLDLLKDEEARKRITDPGYYDLLYRARPKK